MEKIEDCPVCGDPSVHKESTCKDFVATGKVFDLYRCPNCTFLFTNPRPGPTEIGEFYKSDNYVSHAGDKKNFSFIYRIYDIVRDFSIRRKIKHIKSYHPSGRLMDLGCGLGYFLDGVTKDGSFNTVGVDVSEEAIAFVKSKFGLDVKPETDLDTFEKGSFDVITQWHVLEHVHLLNERMIQLKRLLKPDGTLFIAVPNSDSWDARHYKTFWDGYDVPRHLYHFNQKSFRQLMNKHGFSVVETRNMPFDAPYISMRSEVHSGRSFVFARGAVSGVISNLSARSSKNYSSLLFVVKNNSL